MDPHEELQGILATLNAAELDYAICGGLALAVYGIPRATKNVDILIQSEDLEKVKEAVSEAGFTLTSGIIPFRSNTPEETKLYRVTKVDGSEFLILDLLLVTPILETAWNSRQTMRIGKRTVKVVSKDSLIAMKERAGRPQDLADIDNLKKLKEEESENG